MDRISLVPCSRVDISASIERARAAVAAATPDDGPYAELMATYVEFGELLEAWNRHELNVSEDEFEAMCGELVERTQSLGSEHGRFWNQRVVVWMATSTTHGHASPGSYAAGRYSDPDERNYEPQATPGTRYSTLTELEHRRAEIGPHARTIDPDAVARWVATGSSGPQSADTPANAPAALRLLDGGA